MLKVLGIKIDIYSKKQALQKVLEFLNSDGQYKIFTPNPEMLVDSKKDDYFKEVLNNGDLNICDGRGLEFVGKGQLKRIPGTDFMIHICKMAAEQGKGIYLLGSGNDRVVKTVSKVLKKVFPNLNIVGYNKGLTIYKRNQGKKGENNKMLFYNKIENEQIINEINNAKPDILFTAFGHGKQEKWIYKNLDKMSTVKIAMGVGGAFDYISGKIKRAPKWMRKIGLEWLYRLIKEPKRVRRIWKATIVFIILCLIEHRSNELNGSKRIR